jgi:hypothetical protein
MTKAVDYRKIVKEFNPNVDIMEGFDRHILSLNLKEEKIEVFYSLWGVVSQLITSKDLAYADAMSYLIKKVQVENSKRSDVTYYFYDDLPNPELN